MDIQVLKATLWRSSETHRTTVTYVTIVFPFHAAFFPFGLQVVYTNTFELVKLWYMVSMTARIYPGV